MEKRIIELYRRKFDDIRHEADGIEYEIIGLCSMEKF